MVVLLSLQYNYRELAVIYTAVHGELDIPNLYKGETNY